MSREISAYLADTADVPAGGAMAGTERLVGLTTGDALNTWLASQIATYVLLNAALTGTPTAPTASPGTDTTQVATTAFVAAAVAAAVTGLLDFKGSTNASANPNYPAASKGDAYVVSVAGKIGGASGVSVDIGDVYVASADNAGGTQASVGSSWFVLEHNLTGALLSANNLSDLANATTARANLGIADPLAVPSGRYMLPAGVGQSSATAVAPGADSMRMHLGYIRRSITVSELVARISSGAAAGNMQIAIYSVDATTLAPTGAPLYSSASQSTASAAVIGPTGLSLALAAGWYWFATNSDAATPVYASKTALNTDMAEILGSTTATNVLNSSNNITGMVKSQTFGTWPTLSGNFTTDSITAVTAHSIPLVAFKV